MVYDLDFSKPVPADNPAPTFDTLNFYLRGEGQSPYERQRAAAARREEVTVATAARLDAALRQGRCGRDRRGRTFESRLHRRSRVWYPGRSRNRRRNPSHPIRPDR